MVKLTEEQQHALDVNLEPRLLDPRTNKAYVLVGAELYERMRGLLADDADLAVEAVIRLVRVDARVAEAVGAVEACVRLVIHRNAGQRLAYATRHFPTRPTVNRRRQLPPQRRQAVGCLAQRKSRGKR